MSHNSQDRFDRLFPNRAKPGIASQGLSSAERELLEYDEKRNRTPKAQVVEGSDAEDDYLLAQVLTKSSGRSKSIQQRQGHIPGTNPNTVAFVPFGVSKGGLSATTIDQSDDGYHVEPASSNTQLLGRFCLFNLVVKFPYKYMQDPSGEVSQEFFAAEKVYNRKWDMHYIRDPETGKLLMFVPLKQVQELTSDINAKFSLKICVPPYPFQISFYKGAPAPIRLGTVDTKQDLVNLQELVPDPPSSYGELSSNATDVQEQDYAVWREKLERAVEAQKNKNSGRKQYREMKRQMRIANDSKALARTQQYFGVVSETVNKENTEIDMSRPAPYPFEKQPVFISVDIESWERDHKLITEIGVSTIDTLDLMNLAPESWHARIRSRHFRISGREKFANRVFVHGCPDHFQFGVSEFVPIEEAARIVDSCFAYPFSAGYECEGPVCDENGTLLPQKPTISPVNPADEQKKRNVILLGHGIDGDISYMLNLGCSIVNPSSADYDGSKILETLDTTVLYRSYKKSETTASLATVCKDVGIDTFFLHNAGNDARYTLEALIKIALLAKPEPMVEKIVQEIPPASTQQNSEAEITYEEANRRYLEKAGLGVNDRVNHGPSN